MVTGGKGVVNTGPMQCNMGGPTADVTEICRSSRRWLVCASAVPYIRGCCQPSHGTVPLAMAPASGVTNLTRVFKMNKNHATTPVRRRGREAPWSGTTWPDVLCSFFVGSRAVSAARRPDLDRRRPNRKGPESGGHSCPRTTYMALGVGRTLIH